MDTKRSEIGSLLKEISKKQRRYENLSWPNINYFPPDRRNTSHSENDDLEFFYSYAKREAEKQTNFSLCRSYKVPVAVSGTGTDILFVCLISLERKRSVLVLKSSSITLKLRVNNPSHIQRQCYV